MLRFKAILQYSNILLYIFIITIIVSLIRCNIKTNPKYSLEDKNIQGVLIDKKIDGDKLSFIIKGKEKVKCVYYLKSEKEKEYYENVDLGISLELHGEMNRWKILFLILLIIRNIFIIIILIM